jgi:beta-phosphoglucomutase-like phosphatase (HAD superfamily)
MICACLFDLDGTLVDTELLWAESLASELAALGQPLRHEEAVRIVYGRSWEDVYAGLHGRVPGLPSKRDMERRLGSRLRVLRAGRDISIGGSVRLLRSLAAVHPVCIVSGSPRADVEEMAQLLDIGACLRFVLGAEDYAPGKPDPACFLEAARRLGLAPADCVVFEDSAAGVRAAKAAGMRCVALVRDGAPAQDVGAADVRLDDLWKFRPDMLPDA